MNRWRERVRQLAYAAAGAAFGAATVLVLVGENAAGLLAVSVGGGAMTVAMWADFVRADLRATGLHAKIARMEQNLGAAVSDATDAAAEQVHEQLMHARAALSTHVDKRNVAVHQRFDRVDSRLDQVPGLSVELARLVDRVRPEASALPFTGGWALGAGTLIAVVEAVLDSDDLRVIVECGSGASTVWTAAALRTLGSGHVYALEHDAHFASQTRDQLRTHGLEDWGTVIDAPLDEVTVDGKSVLWFDLDALSALPETIDLLMVDGPPGVTGPLARQPAYPVLRDRLRIGSIIVLDDTDRAEEQQVAAAWLAGTGLGPRLVERKVVGRSTFYRVEPETTH